MDVCKQSIIEICKKVINQPSPFLNNTGLGIPIISVNASQASKSGEYSNKSVYFMMVTMMVIMIIMIMVIMMKIILRMMTIVMTLFLLIRKNQ